MLHLHMSCRGQSVVNVLKSFIILLRHLIEIFTALREDWMNWSQTTVPIMLQIHLGRRRNNRLVHSMEYYTSTMYNSAERKADTEAKHSYASYMSNYREARAT